MFPERTLSERIRRVCGYGLASYVLGLAGLVAYARCGHDALFEAHRDFSTLVLRPHRRSRWKFWQRSFYLPVLSREEERCLETWMTLLRSPLLASGSLHDDAPPELARRLRVHDTIALYEGLDELQCGVHLLQWLFASPTTVLTELRREREVDRTFLHARLEFDLGAWFPFTRQRLVFGQLPVWVTLQLEPADRTRQKDATKQMIRPGQPLQITAVENRWFGGPIWSYQADTLGSIWGDVGDLFRCFNAFLSSIVVPPAVGLAQSLVAARSWAAQRVQELQEEQERALAL